jgi:CHAT domain-containing protein
MTGAFAFLPIHAAGIYEGSDQECCSDFVVSSYTPKLTSLLQAQQDAQVPTTNQLKLLLVAAELAQDPSLPRLRFVGQETREIADIAERSRVSLSSLEPTAVVSEVITALESAHVVHFACHGIQHGSKPHRSHFCLRNSNLTVEDLMKADLKNAFFAFLSACETAKGDQTYADETVHLAATMLFAGFRSVVATMW